MLHLDVCILDACQREKRAKLRIAILIRALYEHWSRTPHSAPLSDLIKAFLLVQVPSSFLCLPPQAKYTYSSTIY